MLVRKIKIFELVFCMLISLLLCGCTSDISEVSREQILSELRDNGFLEEDYELVGVRAELQDISDEILWYDYLYKVGDNDYRCVRINSVDLTKTGDEFEIDCLKDIVLEENSTEEDVDIVSYSIDKTYIGKYDLVTSENVHIE